MCDKLISVIIPTYGGNQSLKRAIDSVLLQDYPRVEVVVVDDNPPEFEARSLTEGIMADYRCDSRVVYCRHECNKGGAAARNTGVRASKGEYIGLLDDDDRFLQGKLSKQAAYLEAHPEFDAVYCWRQEGGNIVKSTQEGDLSASLLDLSFTPCTPSLLMRRDSFFDIGGFDETFRRHQDFEFLLRYFKRHRIGVVQEVLFEVIGNGVDNQPKGANAVEIKRKFLHTFEKNIDEIDAEQKGFKKRVYARHYAGLMTKLLRYGNFGLFFRTYAEDAHKGGALFWSELFGQLITIVKKHLR